MQCRSSFTAFPAVAAHACNSAGSRFGSSRCCAVHPGYGFLSENADFVDACENAGVAFLGPTGATMRMFSRKHTAREFAQNANVPVLPGAWFLPRPDPHPSNGANPIRGQSISFHMKENMLGGPEAWAESWRDGEPSLQRTSRRMPAAQAARS